MTWITEGQEIVNWLYDRQNHDTFAFEYGENLTIRKYAVITKVYAKDRKNYANMSVGEPYNIIADVEIYKNPSDQNAQTASIAYDPKSEDVFLKRGVGLFSLVYRINTEPLKVKFDMDRSVIARCDECGQETEIHFEEKPTEMREQNGEMVTPCCYASWTAVLDDQTF